MRNLRLSLVKVSSGGGRCGFRYGFTFTCLLLLPLLFSSLISITEAKRSACWRYGHSCWGGHGKRSGSGGELDINDVNGNTNVNNDYGGLDLDLPLPRRAMMADLLRKVAALKIPLLKNPIISHGAPTYHHERFLGQRVPSPPPLLYFSQLSRSSFPRSSSHFRKVKREDDDSDFEKEEIRLDLEPNSSSTSINGVLADSSIFVRDRKLMDSGSSGSDSVSSFDDNFMLSSSALLEEQRPIPERRIIRPSAHQARISFRSSSGAQDE